ncbi:macrophage colony-stimulating factor 1 receptor isoform X2 [Hyperolius riggenbachi]|uniref:macrophage colony-stimulating factor 1 receptor isoform X2 n=1 Tax=Hyperolius riggenbachi TaxID=752182 RepID=UPI0035A3133E
MGPAVVVTLLISASLQYGVATPVITPSGNHIVIQKGESLNISCSGNGTVRWDMSHNTRNQRKGISKSSTPEQLRIENAGYESTGTYTCVSNVSSSSETASLHLFVRDPSNMWSVLSMRVLADEGSDVVLPCLITDPSVPLSVITLSRPRAASFDPRKGFIIPSVQTTDEGSYVCRAKVANSVKESRSITLIVKKVPKVPPTISLSPSQKEQHMRIQGEAFEMTCTARSVGAPPNIRWEHGGNNVKGIVQPVIDGRTWTTHSTLQIPDVAFRDSGDYTCFAETTAGTSTASATLQVLEKGFINISTKNQEVSLVVGESESLTVSIEAYPDILSWKWEHQDSGNVLNDSSQSTLISNDTYRSSSTLYLNRMKKNEEGSYTFYAANSKANASMSFTIIVYTPPEVKWSYNGTHHVTCSALGTPRPTIHWYQCPTVSCEAEDTEPLTGEVTELIDDWRVVSNLDLKDSALNTTIYCVASNIVGNSTANPVFIPNPVIQVSSGIEQHLFKPVVYGLSALGVLLLLVTAFACYKYQQKPKFEIRWQIVHVSEGNHYTIIDPTQLPYNEKWEFPRNNLQFGKTLGAGAFGKVMEATAFGMGKDDSALKVAVKMLKPSAHTDEVEALTSELKILSHLGNHQNIVNLLGACTQGGPILVITEYCQHGDLLNFLRRKAEAMSNMFTPSLTNYISNYKNLCVEQKYLGDSGVGSEASSSYIDMKPVASNRKSAAQETNSLKDEEDNDMDDHLPLDLHDLLNFSLQVAQGMSFLAAKNCIHRDVAARNVLITHGRVAKICDFGLARDIENDNNYVVKGNARLPVKWMAPESIFDCIYTVQSDVWSYGILLWEIFSLGRSPYPGVIVNRKFYKMIKEGYKMDCPDYAPLDLYRIMKSCWDLEPTKRPTFNEITDLITRQMGLVTEQEYANITQQDEGCADRKYVDSQEPLIKGNNYQFC